MIISSKEAELRALLILLASLGIVTVFATAMVLFALTTGV